MLNRVVISVLLLVITACQSNEDKEVTDASAAPAIEQSNGQSKDIKTPQIGIDKNVDITVNTAVEGRVVFIDIEGGFYGIELRSGQKILPINLDKQYAIAGNILRFKAETLDVMTIQQWGTPMKISKVELVSKGNKVTTNPTH